MVEGTLDIRTLEGPDEMLSAVTVFQQVWGTVSPVVSVELLQAISHAGGYVAGAFDAGNMVGASLAFLARHGGQPALHSHVTGILPGVQASGLGRAMKRHQRAWAADRDIDWITWTFDPLVRHNAWFNLEVLGAHVAEYLVDFYGEMTDSINSGDESDRLMVAWPTSESAPPPSVPDGAVRVEVETPDDIVVLRRTDPNAALAWRRRLRDELGTHLQHGAIVTGFTREGTYVVQAPVAHLTRTPAEG